MTRVLLVTNDYPPKAGGIQQYLVGLMGAIDGPVRILAPRDEAAEGDIHRDRRRFMWPSRRIRRWVEHHIAEFQPDLVLFGAPHPLAWLGPGLRAATGVPYGVVVHGAEITIPAAFPVTRQLLRRPLRRADVLFAVSEFTRGKVERLTGRRVVVIGAGVDPSFQPGDAPADPPVVVGCVSRFVPRKGQHRVLKVCADLRSEGHDVAVALVGRGRSEGRLRRLAARLDLPVRFEVDLGFADLPDAYRRLHIFAMPCHSRWFGLEAEGFGVVFIEAAASGLPVIAGDSGGAPETVAPGATGFVVDGRRSLQDAIRLLVEDPDLRREMADAGLARARDRYSWDAVGERFRSAADEVIRGS